MIAEPSPAQSLGVVPSIQPQPEAPASAPNPTNDTLALIHLKLRQWSETKTGDKETQARLMNELQAMLTDENAAEIMQSLSTEEMDSPLGISALFHWMNVDPLTAANWMAARPDATEDQAWVVAHNLLTDSTNLHSYCDQLPDTGWKQNFLADAGFGVLSKNPVEAINLAQRMDPGSAQTNLLQTVAYDWISRDPNPALDWIMGVNDPSLQERLIAAGAKAVAMTDPSLAAGWLVSGVQSEGLLNDTVPNIVEIWAGKDPSEAANWVAQFPDGVSREAAVNIVSSHWLQSDSGAATAWILTLPERDKILTKLISDQAEPAADSR